MGIPPAAFWRLSVAEWRMLTGGAAALGRGEMEALMARFPDEVPSEGALPPCRALSPMGEGPRGERPAWLMGDGDER
jgi:uncharacterized phage protein (TIGR02216 family)